MRHKLSTAQYSQGWLESQIESMVNIASSGNNAVVSGPLATVMMEQWVILSDTFDDLVKENAELKRKMAIVESALL